LGFDGGVAGRGISGLGVWSESEMKSSMVFLLF
jgi:hypothetical protein